MDSLGALDDLDQVLTSLAERLGEVTGGPVPLEGGITNRNYRVRLGEREYVVRLPGKEAGLLGISREAESVATETAAALGISPGLVAADARYLVTEYVEAEIGDADAIAKAPERIAETLRRFHDSAVGLPVRFWVPDLLESYAEIVLARGGQLPPAYEEARELAQRIARRLPLVEPAPCHNDLLPTNILRTRTGRIALVDWEYAGMGHRLFDLGNLAVNAELGEGAELRLLAAYLGREPGFGDHAALRLMRIMSDAREAAWGVVQHWLSDLDFDFDGYAEAHFERLRASAADPRMEDWLDAATA